MTVLKICRFQRRADAGPAHARYGLLEGERVRPFAPDASVETLAALLEGETGEPDAESPVPLEDVRLLAPVAPTKIVCVGRNYKEHAAELGNEMPTEPLLFLKPPSAVAAPGDFIELPSASQRVEHEGEIGVVIGRRARDVGDEEDPLSYVLGYTCLNDVTARDLQRRDVQFTRGKSFDTFCPVGPYVVAGIDPLDLQVETRVNGEVRQRGRTSQMAFPIPHLVRYISRCMTLEPGDLIATGTDACVVPLAEGDTVEVEVESVGLLLNRVRARRAPGGV